jgi:hypothetical protein
MSLSRRSHATLAAAVFALIGCRYSDLTATDNSVASVYAALGNHGYSSDVFLTLGVQDTLRAQASTGGWPTHTVYASATEPRRFQFSSTNPAVAKVDLDGVVTTVSVGETVLMASVDGVNSPEIRLAVSPPASSLSADPTAVSARVGDTFTVSVKALDANGQSIANVIFNMGLDTTYWALTSEPLEGPWKLHTPIVLHFQAKAVGHLRLIATVQNERAEARFQVSVPVTIDPR